MYDPAECGRILGGLSDRISDRVSDGHAIANSSKLADSVPFADLASNDRAAQRPDRKRDLGAHW
jgi:hypothetical protein